MKKHFLKLIIAGGIVAMAASCGKDYLAEKPFSSYSPSTVNDSLGFEASLSGLYNHMSTFFTYSDQQGWPCVWQVGTDIAFAAQAQGIEVPYFNYATLTSTDGAASYTWSWCYRMINNTNTIIASVEAPGLAMGQTNKNQISAEARFFRAYAYNVLSTCFGGVPITTSPITSPKTDFVRAPLDSVNSLIVRDLAFATTNLPDIEAVKNNAKGRMYQRANKFQAAQLLAEVYLRTNQPALAEQQTQTIINSGKFSLISARYGIKASQPGDYYSDMFWYGNQRRNQGNREALWVLEEENTSTVVGGYTNSPQQRRVWGAAYYQIAGMAITDSLGGRGIARLRLNNWVVYNLYAANDMRNSRWNLRRQYYYNDPSPTYASRYGQPVPYVGADTQFKIAPHITKWYQYDPNDVFGFAMVKDFILMRLGETYLLQAEAQIMQNKMSDAATSINVLRTRAQAPAVTAAQMNMDFLLDERARELIGEENRRMTLMRTKTLVDRVNRYNLNTVLNPTTGISAKNLLMPIPQSEIDLNKDARLEQNAGY